MWPVVTPPGAKPPSDNGPKAPSRLARTRSARGVSPLARCGWAATSGSSATQLNRRGLQPVSADASARAPAACSS